MAGAKPSPPLANKTTIGRLASLCCDTKSGCFPHFVDSWEKGKRLPLVYALAKIEKLTGIISQQRIDWYDTKPTQNRRRSEGG